jgi:microcystin-dependent protein
MLKKISIVLFASMSAGSISPAVAGADPFIGERMVSAFSFCPTGYAAMNGQLLVISQNTALFSLLGTSYGGDGRSNFALPTAKPIVTATGAILTQCIALQGIFPPRN